MNDTLAAHSRLIAAGLSEDQARLFLHLIVDAESGSFDRRTVHGRIAAAGFSASQIAILLEELLQRIARQARGNP